MRFTAQSGMMSEKDCERIGGRETYEFAYDLDEEQTRMLFRALRKKYDPWEPTETILKQAFGYEDGSVRFESFCREADIAYRFFAY